MAFSRFATASATILTMLLASAFASAQNQAACTEDDVHSLQAKVLEFHCWAMNDYGCIKQFRSKGNEKDRTALVNDDAFFKNLMKKKECAAPNTATDKYSYFKQILERHAADRAYEKFLRDAGRTLLTKPLAQIPRAGDTLEGISNNAFDAAAEYQQETACPPASAETKQNAEKKFVFQIWGAGGNCGKENYNLTDKGIQQLLQTNDSVQLEALQANPAICKWARGFTQKYEGLLAKLRENGDKAELTYQPTCDGTFVTNFEVATADKPIALRLSRGNFTENTLLRAARATGANTECAIQNQPIRAYNAETEKEIPIDAANKEMKQTPTTTAASAVARYSKAISENGCCKKNGDDQAKCIRDTIHDAGGSFTNEKTAKTKANEAGAKDSPNGRR